MISLMKIHFICRGNVLRSLIAETYLKSLNLDNINVISSGTNVDWNDPKEREYFHNTLQVLKRHNIDSYAKAAPHQLDQNRLDEYEDLVIVMNQKVLDEVNKLVVLRRKTYNWEITDIGEGNRINTEDREQYEEEIYQEIINKVNELFPAT
jgi:protein-tyrosine-phosphatase